MERKYIITKMFEFVASNASDSRYFTRLGLKTEDVFGMIDFIDSYRDLYPGYDDDNINEYSDEYYFSSESSAYNDVNSNLETFDSLPEPIDIHRSIKVNSKDDIDYDDLGESWSFDKQSAINFANNQAGGNYLITGKTKSYNVDWKRTIKTYYDFSGGYDGYDENEVTIIDSSEVFDITVEEIRYGKNK